MTVELRYCETCGVIIPVDRERPGTGQYICDQCRTVAEPASEPEAPRPAAGTVQRPELAATQPVTRPPRPQARPVERPVEQPAPARVEPDRPRRDPTVLLGTVVLLPILLGAAILICTVRGKGFAVRGQTGERLEWLGERAARGATRFQEIVLGTRGAVEDLDEGEDGRPFATTGPPSDATEPAAEPAAQPGEAPPVSDPAPKDGRGEIDTRPR